MSEGARTVCTACRWDAPLTEFWREIDNPVVRKFWGVVPVVNACSFMFFVHGNGYRDLIHGFKYRGRWRQALEMGEWFGGELFRGGLYSDIDIVVPVPLHVRKTARRGYNQSEYIARGMASALGAGVDTRSVVRTRHNPSQALKEHSERWDNVKGIFAVRRPDKLSGRHILIVDDVLTTGATISSCAEAIAAAVPDCRISIATLAVSRSDIETV
jgi:ComF family protein